MCKPRSSPYPPHRSPTSFQREGRDYGGGGVGWGWMQFQPQSRAPWLEAIFSLGPRAACTLVLSPHSPPAKPHPTGLPTDHSHAQGTHVCESQGDDSGVSVGGCRREVLAQSPCRGGQWRDQGSSPSSWPPAAAYLGLPSTDVQTATSPSLLASESKDPSPQDLEPEGWLHTTLPTAQPPHQPTPFLLSWVRGEQMGSGEADPLPKPAQSKGWSQAREEGGPRPCEGRLCARAPQTHVVGLKKLLGSEALAGVWPALTPAVGRGGQMPRR